MASNILIKFDGIDGESTQTGFEKWIEVNSIQFGCSAPVNATSGTGLASGKGSPSSYTLSTEMGVHSALLQDKMLQGKHHTTVEIRVLKLASAATAQPYFTIDGKKGYVESLSWSAGPDGQLQEHISVVLEEHKWEYWRQETEGGALSATGAHTYNLQKGETS